MMNINTKIYAQDQDSLKKLLDSFTGNEPDPSAEGIGGFVNSFLALALPLSVICLFLLLSFSAYKLMTSRGDPEKLKDAKEQISSAIMGFIFIVLSVAILGLISNILGLEIVK